MQFIINFFPPRRVRPWLLCNVAAMWLHYKQGIKYELAHYPYEMHHNEHIVTKNDNAHIVRKKSGHFDSS